ncbi:RNA-binding protein 12 [Araneus ventricosus]|uniref:RNA-binding protein 12 n=1 Tax=Araneus ventricosus TaxID=182803 RepID=A0A4Y2FM52_ARAVE|nr:RNA-binding protein 12 [Araneus ventricosus]
MSIIIRLQNLPWAADSGDIRRYFAGLSIPEGGVHIVGGEMGDAFIAFSTDEDARLAMEKDGGKIHEMQIKLLLSSRTEMMRVIEKARQQNLALQSQYTMPLSQPMIPMQQPVMQMQQPVMSAQQPIMSAQQPIMSAQQPIIPGQQPMMSVPQPMMPAQQPMMPAQQPIISVQQPLVPTQQSSRMAGTPVVEGDRKRGRSPSPSHRRGRDKSPPRDRRRSPDRRDRSKRDRSRSPARRGSRDIDRRGDRFKRDDRRYDEGSRYRDDRHSDREDSKRHDADGLNRHSSDGYRQSSNHGYYVSSAPAVTSTGYNYDPSQMIGNSGSFYNFPANEKPNALVMDKQNSPASNAVSAQVYMQQPMSFTGMPYDQAPQVGKEAVSNTANDSMRDKRRQSRFEGEYASSQEPPFFPSPTQNQKAGENSPFGDKRGTVQDFRPPTRSAAWPQREDQQENTQWAKKRSALLEPPTSKNGDSLQVVPMDLEQSPPQTPESKNPFGISDQYVTQIAPVVFPTNDIPKKEEMVRRGPDILNDNKWREPPITVEVRGIPPDVRINEMLDLFPNISIPSSNICIKANNQGAEKVFIRFNHPSECVEVLNRQPYYIRNYCCQVSPCPVEEFEAAAASSNSGKPRPKSLPREEDLFVQLKGLPFSCNEADIEHFFKGLRIVDMVIEASPDGRCTGVGFVQFSSSNDFRVALSMNGNMIGHRYITISVASKEIADQARRSSDHLPKRAKSPPHSSGPPGNFGSSRSPRRPKGPNDVPPSNLGNGPPPPTHGRPTNFSVSLRGLPDHVTNADIAEFFSETGIGIRAFHIMLNADKLPNGDAFIEVASKGEADAAVSLNGKMMRGKRVSVTHISFQRMSEILHGPPTTLTPPPVPGPLLQTPPNHDRPRRPLIPHVPEEPFADQPPDNPPMFDGPPNDHPPYEHPRGERPFPPRGNRPRPDFPRGGPSRPDFPRGGQPRPDFPRGGQPRPDFPHGERPRMDGPFRGGGRPRMERPGGPPHGRMRAPFPNRPPYGGPPPSRGGIPPGFGAPGCVVGVNNLHFRASLEDVLDFFKDYKLTKDSVMRRFNENDQVTGEARVAFQTPREAQKAVRELNHKPIMGRSLSLTLL